MSAWRAESFARLIALALSCLRRVEAELEQASREGGDAALQGMLQRVQQLRPLVELIELTGSRGDEGDDDGRNA